MTDLSNIPLSRAELKQRKQQDALTNSSSLSGDAVGGRTADCWTPNPYPSVVFSSNVVKQSCWFCYGNGS
jgi:hypothetical protein